MFNLLLLCITMTATPLHCNTNTFTLNIIINIHSIRNTQQEHISLSIHKNITTGDKAISRFYQEKKNLVHL